MGRKLLVGVLLVEVDLVREEPVEGAAAVKTRSATARGILASVILPAWELGQRRPHSPEHWN